MQVVTFVKWMLLLRVAEVLVLAVSTGLGLAALVVLWMQARRGHPLTLWLVLLVGLALLTWCVLY